MEILKLNKLGNEKITVFVLGLIFFCFSISAALIFQKLLLPNLTSMLAPGTTLTTDSAYFDSVAAEMVQKIRLHGWSSWQLFPNGYADIHVSILSVLYTFFGHDSTLAIPVNALLHALGGILVFKIVMEISSSHLVGLCAGIIASCLFVLFPSALNWYGQIHKDGYAIIGLLAILLIWLKGLKVSSNTVQFLFLIALSFLALCFVVVIRAYYFKLLLLFAMLAFITIGAVRVFLKRKNAWAFFFYVLLTFVPAHIFLDSIGAFSQQRSGEAYAKNQADEWKWQASALLPSKIDGQLEIVAKTRIGLIDFGMREGANSLIDADKKPSNATEVITYLPRGFQVALLAPFPTTWLEKISITRMLASSEMVIIYLCLLGLLPLIAFNLNAQVVLAFCFSAFFLSIYGFTIANVGTLYRVRYPFELMMVALGVIGWVSYFNKKDLLTKWISLFESQPLALAVVNPVADKTGGRKAVVGTSIIVGLLTLVGFVGFFLRDVLMAYQFGFGENLDTFYLALLIPMFLVSVFCMPLGAAAIPFFNRLLGVASHAKLTKITSHLAALSLGVLFVVAIAIYLLSPFIFHSFNIGEASVASNANLPILTALALIILIFSGVVILGNALLMAKERLIIPSAAQLIVPVAAILSLIFLGSLYGAVAVMCGMVIGQFLNLVIIHYYLRKEGVGLTPRYSADTHQETSDLWMQYFPLLASAFFASVMLPIDIMLASTLENGSVSIFNMGIKIVLFVSGVLSAVVSNVMLPYFSSMVEKKHSHMAKKELSFFILMATFIAVPASILLYLFSEQVVQLIFYSNTFPSSDLLSVERVMQYSVIQIPFFICNILLLKYATATRHLSVITLSAFVGLILNVGLSLLLMPKMGVAGIALATSIAMMASSILILLMLMIYKHVNVIDTTVVLLNWMLFLTVIISVHFQSLPSIVMTVVTYTILLCGYIKLVNSKGDLLAF